MESSAMDEALALATAIRVHLDRHTSDLQEVKEWLDKVVAASASLDRHLAGMEARVGRIDDHLARNVA